MTGGPARGLPPRTYLPILVLAMLAFLGVVGYFLKIGLGVTGAALGPAAQQGDANIRVTPAPGDVVVPQSGGAPNGVGGGTPVQAAAGGPPAPIARLLLDLRERLQRDPKDTGALVSLANMYAEAAKYPQALPYYKRALALEPANPEARTDYAAALHGTGDDAGALRELDTVLARHPAFADALFTEGAIASAMGRPARARAAYKKFLEVKPNDQRAGDARTALQNLGT